MNTEKEYYIGYLRNPKQVIKNGFQDVKEYEVILVHEYNDYRELVTMDKVYLMNKNEVFDGHKVFKSHAGFIGRVGKKLSKEELKNKLDDIRENNMTEYMENIYNLLNDTRELYLKDEEEYLKEVENFKNNTRK